MSTARTKPRTLLPFWEDFPFHIDTAVRSRPVESHDHPFDELHIILEGRGRFMIGERTVEVEAGDLIVCQSGISHAHDDLTDFKDCQILFRLESLIHPHADIRTLPGFHALFYVEPHARGRDLKSRMRLEAKDFSAVTHLLFLMEREYAAREAGCRTILLALFSQFAVYVSRKYTGLRGPAAERYMPIARAASYMENHYTERLLLDDLSRMSAMSKNQFLRVFKDIYGTSPLDYAIRLRIARAKRLLRDSTKRISEIAFDCGFSDSNYFSRAFRSVSGISPSTYRRTQIAKGLT